MSEPFHRRLLGTPHSALCSMTANYNHLPRLCACQHDPGLQQNSVIAAKDPAQSAAVLVHTSTLACSAIHMGQKATGESSGLLGHALHCVLQWDVGWDRACLSAPGAGVVGHRSSPKGHSWLSLICFKRNVTATLGNNDSQSLSEGKGLTKKACITLCSLGTGN